MPRQTAAKPKQQKADKPAPPREEEQANLPPIEQEHEHDPTPHRQPCWRTRYGRVEAAVWEKDLDDGRKVFSVTLQRSYQDREGKWQRTASMDEHDLLPAAKALDECYVYIQKQRQAAIGYNSDY